MDRVVDAMHRNFGQLHRLMPVRFGGDRPALETRGIVDMTNFDETSAWSNSKIAHDAHRLAVGTINNHEE